MSGWCSDVLCHNVGLIFQILLIIYFLMMNNVWAEIINNKLIGPHLLDGTLTGEHYLVFLGLYSIADFDQHLIWCQS